MPDREDRTTRIEKELFLRSLQIGQYGSVAETMAGRLRPAFFPAGTVLYRMGEAAPIVIFVVRGEVRLDKPGQEPWTFRDRDVVGILDVMMDRPRDRTATATQDTHALLATAEDWFDLLEDNFEVTRHAIQGVARGIFEMSLRLAPTGGFPAPAPDDATRPIHSPDTVERIILLREAPLLKRANVQALVGLAELVEEVRAGADEPVFRRGEPADAFFLVVRGHVEITRDDPVVRADFGPGEVVGGYGAIAHAERQFDATARETSLLFRVGIEDYFDVMEEHFELARSLLAEMARFRELLMNRIAGRERLATSEAVVPSAP